VTARVLRETEDAREIDIDNSFPVFFRVLGGRRAANDARIVNENIDGAEVRDRLFDEAGADCGIAYVTGECD
jgi:hypothetical protein